LPRGGDHGSEVIEHKIESLRRWLDASRKIHSRMLLTPNRFTDWVRTHDHPLVDRPRLQRADYLMSVLCHQMVFPVQSHPSPSSR
jgi:hypothetical protein